MSENKEVVVRVSQLSKKFGAFTAVDHVSFDIYKGEIFGFLGPNGAGKTTSINMICGILPPSSGEISFNGNKIGTTGSLKNKIGICPQENIHWDKLTCFEQLVFMGNMYDLPPGTARENANRLLEFLGLIEKSGVLARKLSGGMKRRLNIALALIHDPEILVLDEPEAGLDPQSRVLVRDFIKSLAREKTIILTTHNMDEADRLSDRVAIMDHGKLLMIDTPQKLKQSIGEGDVMVLELDREPKDVISIKENLCKICKDVNVSNSTLRFHGNNLMESVPKITRNIGEMGYSILKMTLRENTLEDVFIHLTGNKLRE
ncbi:MAG: ABC transporter ATP-binding protein [Bacteroidales bacterium]|nr:ABC transporter ATP-binding protein [Bacteroidales bacterium]